MLWKCYTHGRANAYQGLRGDAIIHLDGESSAFYLAAPDTSPVNIFCATLPTIPTLAGYWTSGLGGGGDGQTLNMRLYPLLIPTHRCGDAHVVILHVVFHFEKEMAGR